MIYVFIIFWLGVALVDYAEMAYIWQLKEYRLDRFNDYLSTKQGKDFVKSYFVAGRATIFLALILLVYFRLTPTVLTLFIILILEIARIIFKYKQHLLHYPKKTKKVILVISLSLLVEFLALFLVKSTVLVLMILCLRFVIISLVVGAFYLPTKFAKNYFIIMAARKLLINPQVKVIGVTGSYGKSTVKTFLGQILQAKYKVITTPKNTNTEIGIAKFILETDFKDVEIFVVEMGAYKIGEIKLICEMVKPEIGILTAINEQHLSLFGSIRNTQKAKYELLYSLPVEGLAIVNNDNQYCREYLDELKSQVKTFGRKSEFKPTGIIKHLKQTVEGIQFDYRLGDAGLKINSPVVGEHNAMNIAPCILVARELGIANEVIVEEVKKIELPAGTLKVVNYGESIVLDDSYNANPAGFKAALKVLGSYSSDYKKVVITRGMLELGKKSQSLHKKIGEEISKFANELIIINKDNSSDLRSGIVGNQTEILEIFKADKLLEKFKEFKDVKAVVLLENRAPDSIIQEINNSVVISNDSEKSL